MYDNQEKKEGRCSRSLTVEDIIQHAHHTRVSNDWGRLGVRRQGTNHHYNLQHDVVFTKSRDKVLFQQSKEKGKKREEEEKSI